MTMMRLVRVTRFSRACVSEAGSDHKFASDPSLDFLDVSLASHTLLGARRLHRASQSCQHGILLRF